jgi:flagellar motor switch/type III secretory pathway protein FliN
VFAGKKSAQIREILISESAWEDMTCLFAPSLNIEFVLSETTMTLAEISKIQIGDVLDSQIGLGGNKVDVELRVQGRTLAKGELILLNDRLAVEIEEVYNTL